MSTPYDEVPYPNLPFAQTHPDRLAALATLFGMEPAPPAGARVLELGCGAGENIIPMAFQYPQGEYLGIDLSERAIDEGDREIAELALTNVRLEHRDIMDATLAAGAFDYVIAHGFYSWVPEPVRDRLLAIVQGSLAPQGVAYISYNALPGGRIRQMFREMMLFHAHSADGSESRVAGARQMMRWFAEGGAVAREQAESILERKPATLYHDELSDIYHPVYFHEFLEHADRFELQFLVEADYSDMHPGSLPEAVVEQVMRVSGSNRILRDQYFDFLKCRTFRQTLLCHAGVELADAPDAKRVPRLHVCSSAHAVSGRPDLGAGTPEEFRGSDGFGVVTVHPFSKATLQVLGEAWPGTLTFDEVLNAAAQLAPQEASADHLAEILLADYAAGVIELHAEPAACVAAISRCPIASPLARSQARRGRRITTLRHGTIETTDEKIRLLIELLDGSHDFAALARALGADLDATDADLMEAIESQVDILAKAGALVG